MKQTERLTEAELHIMRVLWEQTVPVRPSALLPPLFEAHGWHISTLQTLLERMRVKGAVECRREGRFRAYLPTLSREQYAAGVADALIAQVCDESAAAVILTLMKERRFSPADIAAIREAAAALEDK